MSSSNGGGTAEDAAVSTDDGTDAQAQLELLADEAEQAVESIEAKLAGMKDTLVAKRAEAKNLRAQAKKGGQG